jgi:plastocyanin
MLTRRELLQAGGLWLAGLGAGRGARSAEIIEIQMKSDRLGAEVWFDPVGVWIEPGTTIRWVVTENVHTTTAYHPKNDGHSLRMPEAAEPWDSGFLVKKGDHFGVTLTIEGVYDYYCMPHEAAGMVGRIVVGRPGGPGMLPFDYFKGRLGTEGWKPIPEAAQTAFPSVERIMTDRTVRRG